MSRNRYLSVPCWVLCSAAVPLVLGLAYCQREVRGADKSSVAQGPPEKAIMQQVKFDQQLDEPLPLDTLFVDESGREVPLRTYFGERPVLLVHAYYRCPMLCNQVLNGVLKSVNALKLTAGKDFEILVVSFDPADDPKLAAAKRQSYTERYLHGQEQEGWHFLTGTKANIDRLCEATGFRYVYDQRSDQYAHASGILIATPDGRLSRYFYGIDYPPRDVRFGLIEAADGKIGSLVDQVLLTCFHYDPLTGRYGIAIMRLIRGAGILTVVLIVGYIVRALRAERRKVTESLAVQTQ